MLVLSRKPGESLKLGEDITVTVLDVRGDQVRLGIDAPREVSIQRSELFEAIAAANASAADSAARAVDESPDGTQAPMTAADLAAALRRKSP